MHTWAVELFEIPISLFRAICTDKLARKGTRPMTDTSTLLTPLYSHLNPWIITGTPESKKSPSKEGLLLQL